MRAFHQTSLAIQAENAIKIIDKEKKSASNLWTENRELEILVEIFCALTIEIFVDS